jgi:phosphoribosylformylglycinamidine synthase
MTINTKIYNAKVNIFLKPKINDPQGITVKSALHSLNFNVENVRVGKFIEISIEANSTEAALDQVTQMCEKLLANPIIEQFKVNVE